MWSTYYRYKGNGVCFCWWCSSRGIAGGPDGLKVLHKKAEALGLQVYWAKVKVQSFGAVLDDRVQTSHSCGEEVKVTKNSTYLCDVMHTLVALTWRPLDGIMSSLSTGIWRRRYRHKWLKIRIACASCSLHGFETWSWKSTLERCVDASGTKCLLRIMRYR